MKRLIYIIALLLCGHTAGRATRVINQFTASPTIDYAVSEVASVSAPAKARSVSR